MDWTSAEDELLGTGPDQKIAAKLGRSELAVQRRRLAWRLSLSKSTQGR